MVTLLMKRWNFGTLKQKFDALGLKHRMLLIAFVSIVLSVMIGPCSQFYSNKRSLEAEGLARATILAKLLAATNLPALTSGRDVLYDVSVADLERGVSDAFITDATGLVVAPATRFHEDARKDPLVREGLTGSNIITKKNLFGSYEIALPVFNGQTRVGVVRFQFVELSSWWALWRLLRTMILMAAVLSAGAYAVHRLSGKQTALDVSAPQNSGTLKEIPKAGFLFEHLNYINSPVFIFDRSFRVEFANRPAQVSLPNIVGKHILDVGREYMEMAEEMEMLQLSEIKHGETFLWRMKDEKYGLAL